MPLYVRVRNRSNLREVIEAVSTQTDVANATGISLQRVNQLLTSPKPVRMRVELAAKIEAALGLPPGAMFKADADVARDVEMIDNYLLAFDDDEPPAAVEPLSEPQDAEEPTPDECTPALAPPAPQCHVA